MKRFDRIQAILTILQSRKKVTAEELADQFETSVRTIYRDIRSLEAGGIPIGAEAGIGYFLMDGYKIPPIMFTKEEAQSLLIAGKFIDEIGGDAVSKSFQSALTKVKAVLDFDKKKALEELEESIVVQPFPSSKGVQENIPALNVIQSALIQYKVVEIIYHSNYKGEQTSRSVEPIGICFYGDRWHLIGFCQLRKDYRDFRVDRIEKIKIKDESYEKHELKSLKNYINELMDQSEMTTVEISVSTDYARMLNDSKHKMGLVHEREEAGCVYMTFTTFCIDYFAHWIIPYGKRINVIQPKSLVDKLKVLSVEIYDHFT